MAQLAALDSDDEEDEGGGEQCEEDSSDNSCMNRILPRWSLPPPTAKPSPDDSIICYVCQLQDTPSSFNREKAVQLGVTVGKKYGQLKAGQSVESDTQPPRTVYPHEVMAPPVPGKIVIIVECTEATWIPAIVGSQCWESYQQTASGSP